MTRQLVAIEIDETIFSLRGYRAHGLALAAGLRPTYSGVRGAWVADTKRLPQFVAYLEHRNVGYTVTEVVPGAPGAPSGTPGADAPREEVSSRQLPLFEGA